MEDADTVRADLRDYAWKYFDRHASQRLLAFQFYITLCVFIAGAVVGLSKDAIQLTRLWPLGLLLAFVSFVFWKLDVRTAQLVKGAECALKRLEAGLDLPDDGNGSPHPCKLFTREESETAKLPYFRVLSPLDFHLSYSKCFQVVFLVFGIAGFVLGVTPLIGAVG